MKIFCAAIIEMKLEEKSNFYDDAFKKALKLWRDEKIMLGKASRILTAAKGRRARKI